MRQSFRVAPFAAVSALSLVVAIGCGNEVAIPLLSATGATGSSGSTSSVGIVTSVANGPAQDLTCPDIPLDATGAPTVAATGTCDTTAKMQCADAPTQQFDPHTMPGYTQPADVDAAVSNALSSLGTEGQIAQMQGVPYTGTPQFSDIERSPDQGNLRGFRYRDAGRGVNLDAGQDNRVSDGKNYSTVFPTESARAASWDLDLEYRVGAAMGDEVVASHNNMLLAPCMNIIRHPYWGRTQETYSEDVYHTGRMAAAFTAGLQTYVVGCAKHFAANNIERLRKDQNAMMNEQTLRELYTRHFEMVVRDGGVGCIMASYNQINGTKSTQNRHLLTDILRTDFGYKGLVISDWWAMPNDQQAVELDPQSLLAGAIDAVNAGLDIEVPWIVYYGHLSEALEAGKITPDQIQQSARNVLTQKYRFNTADASGPWGLQEADPKSALSGASINNEEHQVLAEESELKSAVLLANGLDGAAPVLPLKGVTNIAVIGKTRTFALKTGSCPDLSKDTRHCTIDLATQANVGDRGSSRVNGDPAAEVSIFQGMQQIGAAHGANVTTGADATAAANADAVVVVVGLTAGDEGEEYALASYGDRKDLNLPDGQNELVKSVLLLNKPTVIIVESGSIVNLPWLDDAQISNKNQATIWAGYPGMRGGSALAKLIFADNGANFSGKMPMAWPKQDDLPPFTDAPGSTVTHMGYFFGYRYYDDLAHNGTPKQLVFPFGHGLSYTTFAYSNLHVGCSDATPGSIVNVSVDIQNTGTVDGEEVAMLFVAPPPKPAGITGDRPVKELKSFKKVFVPAGQGVRTTMQLRIWDLRRWEGDEAGHWMIDPGDYTLMVGKDAADADLSNPMVLKDTLTVHSN